MPSLADYLYESISTAGDRYQQGQKNEAAIQASQASTARTIAEQPYVADQAKANVESTQLSNQKEAGGIFQVMAPIFQSALLKDPKEAEQLLNTFAESDTTGKIKPYISLIANGKVPIPGKDGDYVISEKQNKKGEWQIVAYDKLQGKVSVLPTGVTGETAGQVAAAGASRSAVKQEDRQSETIQTNFAKYLSSDPTVVKAKTSINGIDQALASIREPAFAKLIQSFVAREVGHEKGALSNDDVKRALHNQSIPDKVADAIRTGSTGSLTPKAVQEYSSILNIAKNYTSTELSSMIDRNKASLAAIHPELSSKFDEIAKPHYPTVKKSLTDYKLPSRNKK